jgi:mannose-6-phosphate isomerase-like protein (cupin superfamily)
LAHDFQEVSYVVGGYGWARIGEEEFVIEPGVAFVVAPRTLHTLRTNSLSQPLEIFWVQIRDE